MNILTINLGSSSLRFALYNKTKLLAKGHVDAIGLPNCKFIFKSSDKNIGHKANCKTPASALTLLHKTLKNFDAPDAVAHRVVHEGEKYNEAVKIDKKVIKDIEKFAELAPLHNPINLKGIKFFQDKYPKAKQVAVFDTAYYQTLEPKAYLYGLPYELYEKHGIRRYGFHGTSHKYVTQQVPKGRTISCHLGNGCSITASNKHKAVDTSMGMTPLEGVMMGTRSGTIDPAIIFHLKSLGYKLPEIEKILLKKSGLLGFTGISSDMRDIRDAAFKKKNKRALLALEAYSYQIAKQVSAYIASLGGLDHLIFTGGIGTNAEYIRDLVTAQLPLKLHKTKVHVIPTDESLQITKEAWQLLK